MKIILDNIIFQLQKSGGVSIYWFELLKRILVSENKDFNFIGENSFLNKDNICRRNLKIDDNYILKDYEGFGKRFKRIKIIETQPIIFHSSYYRIAKCNKPFYNITTVHDFIQEKTSNKIFNLNSLMKKKAILNSSFIIAVSENTKSDLLNYYKYLNEDDIKVIYNGVSDEFHLNEEGLKIQTSKNILYVGSRAAYKNFLFTISVVSKIPEYKLIIVGHELKASEIQFLNNAIPDRWEIFVNASTSILNRLYNQATALIYPSSYEGFGIPIIEAMKCGCPVITLNNSSIPEVSGGAAILLDKLSIDDFISSIKYVYNNREGFQQKGIANSLRFSWDKTYQETLSVYKMYN